MKELTISKAAVKAGVGIETVRFYERRGLVKQPPKPHGNGFRIYTGEIVTRIRFIKQSQELGFSLNEISELLELRADTGRDCADVRMKADVKLLEVERKITQLKRIRSSLKIIRDLCPGSGPTRACPILEAMEDNR